MGRKQEKSYPARIVPLHDDLSLAATTPCRFTVTIPLRLPSTLEPDSVPAPPYHDHAAGTNLHDLHPKLIAVLRPILVGLLYALWGPKTAVLSLVGPNSGMKQSYDVKIVRDGRYNLETGQWVDQYGVQGAQIDAYLDGGEKIIEVVEGFNFRIDNRLGKDGVENPPVIEFCASDTLQEGAVVFYGRRLNDQARKNFNQEVYDHEWK
ncbi:hypothetical protein GQ53DRAFT_752625 [Thozetella sp. PMI_491]|nr:hypothetical protein GQ53DRAFT_752625 [Thozetella sp. PMI_491]